MGFDSELDSDPDCDDVEGQRMDPVRVANLKTASILGMISNKISKLTIFGHYLAIQTQFLFKRQTWYFSCSNELNINWWRS